MYNSNEIIWKDVENYEGLYQVSNHGEVKRLPGRYLNSSGRYTTVKERILVSVQEAGGYYVVGLCKFGNLKNVPVHRLVAQAFIPNPDNLPQVNHKDGDKSNNIVDNLEWCTARENNEHAWKHKLNRNHPLEIKATNLSTNNTIYYPSVLDFSKATGAISASQCLDNSTICNTPCGQFSLEYTDNEKAEKIKSINSTKQPVGGNTPIPIRCVTTDEIFPSIRKCSEYFHIDGETLRRALRYSNGYVKKYKLQFEFISEVNS